jgi:hypothetical protein
MAVFDLKKNFKKFSAVLFFQFLVIKALDPYWIRIWIRIRIGLQHHTLDPDPEKMNMDPQPCLFLDISYSKPTLCCRRGTLTGKTTW